MARVASLAARSAALLLIAAASAAAQSPPPDGDWRTFRTEHFRVTHEAGLEVLARHAAAVAERTHAVLREELAPAPHGTIDLVVTDHVDFSNGMATPFPSNRIVVFARPPVTLPALAFSRDWIEMVVAHELVHIFHLDRTGPVGSALRTVLGRVPMLWPIFPALGTPIWNVEGLATYYESRLTGGGRVHGSYHDMIVRTAALDARIPPLRRVSGPSPVWPGGERSYIYGAALMDWIAAEHGPDVHGDLVEATARAGLPTFLFFDRVGRRAMDRRFSTAYEEWRRAAADSAQRTRARLEAEGLTAAETVVGRGPFAIAPRLAPDGRRLSYAASDYRSDPATRILDLATGDDVRLARRNQFGRLLGPASWMPDGSALVTAQLELNGRHRIESDLWLIDLDGRERRLTAGGRLAQPDVSPDGRHVAAVQNQDGAIRLVSYDMVDGRVTVLADAAPGDAFDAPRWSPDGRNLAVARYADGRVDLLVLDVASGSLHTVTDDDALAGAPAWSPDGRWLLFWSDRTGIPNIFAVPVGIDGVPDPAAMRQVTNVLGGAFDPEVAPDAATLYFSSYHVDGWHLERMAFEPDAWRAARPPALTYGEAILPEPRAEPPDRGRSDIPHERYSPLPTLGPRFWIPNYWERSTPAGHQTLRFLGAYSTGWDVVQRHAWSASGAVDLSTGRFAGAVSWNWAGLGNPDLVARTDRTWSSAGFIDLGDGGREAVLLREDRAAGEAVLWRSRWRNTARLTLGGDIRTRAYEPFAMSSGALARGGVTLPDLPTIFSLQVRPAFSNARLHPYSVSPQDGISTSAAMGRWWNIADGRHSYDQLSGFLSLYRGFRLWGFADHVAAVRVAGLRRTGDDALPTSIGGTPGVAPDLLIGSSPAAVLLPIRGFAQGVRQGTRAWTASAEYRFPLHLPGDPTGILGLSLASVSGAVFLDAANAWCTSDQMADELRGCPAHVPDPLLATGAEVRVRFGLIQDIPVDLRLGFALPLRGPDAGRPNLHVGAGHSF